MCRLVAYLGCEILMEEILVKPFNSLLMQSVHARESSTPTNGDGFGLGWYAPQISLNPALFTSIFPAWNDRNLLHLAGRITSPCFFGHIRAAGINSITHSATAAVSTYNCHPFRHGKWMLMHNGDIGDFILIKRKLRRLLDDDVYRWIQGETDSEHFFSLFIQLSKGKDLSQLATVAGVLEETMQKILQLNASVRGKEASYFNICLTDGQRLVATRYCSDATITPETMHYYVGDYAAHKANYYKRTKKKIHQCALIASEKMTDVNTDWQDVPPNHLLLVDEDHQIQVRPISFT